MHTSKYPFEELKTDDAWNGIGSSVLWGLDGDWAVATSNEGHGVVAGPTSFVDEMRRNLPNHGGELVEVVDRLYVRDAEQCEDNKRLREMVVRLYGDAVAENLFASKTGESA